MPWFRLDDSFDTHPKVLAAGNEAVGLYIRCGTYAARNLTDGFVGQSVVDLYGNDTLAATLVRVKLWHRARGGWRIHDYLDYNPSREEVLAKRKVRAEAGRMGGVASGKARSKHEANASAVASHTFEPPSRPVPSSGSVGIQSSDRNGRASPDLIDLIITEVRERTGRSLSDEWAQRTYDHILGGRQVANPAAYLREAIRSEADPRTRFLPLY